MDPNYVKNYIFKEGGEVYSNDESEFWTVERKIEQRMNTTKINTLRWISKVTWED